VLDQSLTAFLRKFGDERGLALPFALGVMVVLSALSAGIFTYVTTNQGAAQRARADQRAYGLADAGLSYAFSTLMNQSDPTSPSSFSSGPVSMTGGTVVYEGTLSGNTWTLTGRGTVTNPSGPNAADVVRTVSAQAIVTTAEVGDTRPYDYLFIDQPSGCFTLNNTVTLEVALYVRGDLCLQNNALIKGSPVHVLGNVYVSNDASIGTSGTPIGEFLASGSCYYANVLTTCGPAARIWASTIGTTPPDLTKPTIDLPRWYAEAPLGPMSNCTTLTGSGFPGFDNNTTRDVSLGTVDITPSTAYDCQKKDGAGNLLAQIKWVPGSNPSQTGELTISGTIYFDGNVTWSNLSLIDYDGRATIYASGKLVIKNQADLCGVAACDATWDPSQDFLAFVAGSMISETSTDPLSGDVGNRVQFQGSIYTVNDYDQDNNTTIWGPVIARNATITNSGLFKSLPGSFGDPPPGLPLDTMTVTQVQKVPGSYAG
jgi:Tfp pilus assembly protein PilX